MCWLSVSIVSDEMDMDEWLDAMDSSGGGMGYVPGDPPGSDPPGSSLMRHEEQGSASGTLSDTTLSLPGPEPEADLSAKKQRC